MRIYNGDRVRFRDFGNVRNGAMVEAEGTVNGNSVPGSGGLPFWPVFAEREDGREATTIYVREDNIIGKVHP